MLEQGKKKDLYISMVTPSVVHSYSLATDYAKNWFLNKFRKDFFKQIHIDGAHVIKDFRNYDVHKLLKIQKPNLTIVPEFDIAYDRDKLYSYPYGLDMYLRQSDKEQAFLKDSKNNIYLGFKFEVLRINYRYRCRVQTKSQQIDLGKYMQIAFRVGYTQGADLTLDYHIPYVLMAKIAKDAGFELDKNSKIINVMDFVKYLNSHSQIPIIFKFRAINQKMEFFLRLSDVHVRMIMPDDLSIDDGDRIGMIQDNFFVEMNMELQIPSPKMFMYYSATAVNNNIDISVEDTPDLGLYYIKLCDIPDRDNKEFELYVTTQYECTDISSGEPINIDFKNYIEGDTDLNNIITYNESIKMSPSIFMSFKLFNGGIEIPFTINWENMILTVDSKLADLNIDIAVYVDLTYINQQKINKEELNKSS